ncbi:MAG: glutamate-cysteine ligase family protein [bacterium]
MGMQEVKQADPEELRQFMKLLLRDVRALEKMLEDGLLESGIRRIGAEQELFLVDEAFQAAPTALEVLVRLKGDDHFTTELGLFNIELNLDAQVFGGKCLSTLENQLNALVGKAREAAAEAGSHIVMTGILPTLKHSDLHLGNMTPNPRYYALNDALNRLRGGNYSFHIKGADEFIGQHDNVMLEACNTSFQVHFQAGPEEFAPLYNVAQAVAAPALAVACNSPMLFGKRLWRETRIALFEQSVDTRASGTQVRERHPRVSFGHRWLDNSVLEIFQDDIARFRVLINTDVDEDPFEALAQGRAPSLKALRLHNGTIYRWNRACYGISDGVAHLRIENRVMPSGPTTIDEVANAAFWFGLMTSVSKEFPDIRKTMDFDDAKANFLAVARQGLSAPIKWTDGITASAGDIIEHRLLPAAREALLDRGIDPEDVSRYLDVVEERVKTRRTGAMWMIDSFQAMKSKRSVPERLSALTAATITRQRQGDPVHTWPLVEPGEGASWRDNFGRVEQFMTTDIITVNKDEPIELVVSVMDWQQVRHIPIEDNDENLVGLVTYLTVVRYLNRNEGSTDAPVSQIMTRQVITIGPETSTIEAVRLMRERKISCLPVVRDGKLVGLITERDFLKICEELMEEKLA